MKILLAVAALLALTGPALAADQTLTCNGVVFEIKPARNGTPMANFPGESMVGSNPTCWVTFNKHSKAGKQIFATCPDETFCEIRAIVKKDGKLSQLLSVRAVKD